MRRSRWAWAGVLTLAALADNAWAQNPAYCPPLPPPACISGPSSTTTPGMPGQGTTGISGPNSMTPGMPGQGTAGQPSATDAASPGASGPDDYSGLGGYRGSLGVNTGAVGGTGLTSAADNANSFLTPSTANPLILPGLLTAADAQSARPMDRVFFNYSYYDHFRASRTTGFTDFVNPTALAPNGTSTSIVSPAGFNLHRFDIGVEKTFCEGRFSVYVSTPFLYAADNTTGQAIDGLGDVNAGFKVLLLEDRQTGSALSAGFTVSAPTGRDSVLVTSVTVNHGSLVSPNLPPNAAIVSASTTTTLNPTYLQPYVTGLWIMDKFFVQDYLGAIIPTDGQVATFINNDLGVGYQLYRSPDRFLSSVTPTFDIQLLLPVNHEGSATTAPPAFQTGTAPIPASSFGFSDQVFLTPGVRIGLGERALLSSGVVIPVAGPKAFTVGGTIGFNFLF